MEEFIAVCKALRSSVDADASVWDRLNGLVADPAKVRPINHVGRFFKGKGTAQRRAVAAKASGFESRPAVPSAGYGPRQGLSITSLAPARVSTVLDDAATVRSYKSLSLVERAFRCLKTIDLQIRPIYHWLADRIRAHVFLCMLAYYLEWHMRRSLAPMLYDDTDKEGAEAQRDSVVAKAERSPVAITKQTTGRTEDGLPVHSFRTLLADLATLTRNTLVTAVDPERSFTVTARPTALQQTALDLLGLARTQ
jgi:hypothetical protein